ncbi:MAG TPA: winged helix-turn-helix domain-containing protein [Bryobacteraceae bacterium]|nr:winged helix-turn-helix domain-containing protein [Bryobacteraceae bacterium]
MTPEMLRGCRFGPFRMDLLRRSLLKDGQPVNLTPKSFDVLALLVARHGELVSKEEIMGEVWPGVVVEETNLTYQISLVRRALGESAGKREYIITVPGRGYRFVAPVGEGPAEPATVPEVGASHGPHRRRRAGWLIAGATTVTAAVLVVSFKAKLETPRPWRQLTFDRADDTQPDISPDGRYVVFVSNRQGKHNIWRMRADGSEPRNLTLDRGENDTPAWSPDGRRIAFQSTRVTGTSFIFIMNADGSGQHVVSPLPSARAAWAPDGRSILYQSHRGKSGIFRLDLENGKEMRLTGAEVDCFDPSWSPDGKWIIHTRATPAGLQLFAMDARGGGVRQLTRLYETNASVPAWSPDGTRIAFTGARDRESAIYVMRSDGTEIARLTQDFVDAGEAAWSRDGSKIYFESGRTGNSDVYSIEVPAGTGRRITHDVGEDNLPVYSPSGREIAFVSNRAGNPDIYVEDLSTGRLENVTHDQALDSDPAWSPDGQSIAFSSERTGRPQIFVMRRKDGALRQVSQEDGEWAQPAWSPDGKMLAAAWGPAGNTHIRILQLGGGPAVDIAPSYIGAEWPAWSPDGKTIAFDTPVAGANHRIFLVPAQGGEVRPLTDGSRASGHPAWRPDGAVAFNCNCGSGAQIMVLEPSGALRALTNTLPRNIWPSFSKDGTRIIFASNRDGNFEVYEIYN